MREANRQLKKRTQDGSTLDKSLPSSRFGMMIALAECSKRLTCLWQELNKLLSENESMKQALLNLLWQKQQKIDDLTKPTWWGYKLISLCKVKMVAIRPQFFDRSSENHDTIGRRRFTLSRQRA